MIDLHIQATDSTPFVNLNSQAGKIEIRGTSVPEGAIHFYYPIIKKIEKHFSGYKKQITVDVCLAYFNTSSSKCLFDLFKKISFIQKQYNTMVRVNWFYEENDLDMMETGEDYEDVLGLTFHYVELPPETVFKDQE